MREDSSRQVALRAAKAALEKKAGDVVILTLKALTIIADYFVIASATSEPHMRAVLEEVTEKLEQEHGLRPYGVDGHQATGWVVLDYFDVIVHIMRQDVRQHYDLESLWGDAPRVGTRRRRKVTL